MKDSVMPITVDMSRVADTLGFASGGDAGEFFAFLDRCAMGIERIGYFEVVRKGAGFAITAQPSRALVALVAGEQG